MQHDFLLQLENKLKKVETELNKESEHKKKTNSPKKSNSTKNSNFTKEKPFEKPFEKSSEKSFTKPKTRLGKMGEPVNFGILAKPSTYSHTLDEDIREFLHQFDNEAVANDWDDALKLKKIRIAFRGVALNLFDEKIKDYEYEPGKKIDTWDRMKLRIEEVFKKNAALLRKKIGISTI